VWATYYGGEDEDIGPACKVDGSGNVYVTGRTQIMGVNYDYATVKYNSAGVQQWVKTYNGALSSIDEGISIAVDNLNNSYVTGYSTVNTNILDITTIKYNSSGVQQGINTYSGSGSSIAVDNNGYVYVTGLSVGNFATIKYNSLIVDIKQKTNVLPTEFNLYQNYPNPFNPETNIKFEIPKTQFVKISVYDIIGREIRTLVNAELQAGSHNIRFNSSGISSGVYFYKIESGEFVDVKKLIINK
jgi:hypothetical protein